MDSDPTPTDAGGFYTTAPPDTQSYTELGDFAVDGETFQVRRRDSDGSIHYDWISGPNEGYGFSTFGGHGPVSHDHHEASIRDFLSAIDPATGYFFDS
jgi:hypothetical protein